VTEQDDERGKPQALVVDKARDGRMLDALVRELSGGSWNNAREMIRRGKVRVDGSTVTEITTRIAKGREVVLDLHARRLKRAELPAESILYVDSDVVVVNKPAGLMSVPFEDEKDTLVDRTRIAIDRMARERSRGTGRAGRAQPAELGVVQRLDKDTTGVLVFARNLDSKRELQQQFRVHSIDRRYLAVVHGRIGVPFTAETDLIRDRGDGLKGSYGHFRRPRGPVPADAQHAITHVRPIEALRDATLVECKLQTGRQHQIRIHVSERGHPIVGEQVYIRDFNRPRIAAARPMLHAQTLGFTHPRSGKPMAFSIDPPQDFRELLESLQETRRA
jgi:23S rRNA pseudouridine1911/1915/1917 synthase